MTTSAGIMLPCTLAPLHFMLIASKIEMPLTTGEYNRDSYDYSKRVEVLLDGLNFSGSDPYPVTLRWGRG